jgi:hypothetical protein
MTPTTKELVEYVQDWADFSEEPLITFDGLDEAILGIARVHTQPTRVVYSFMGIIKILMENGIDDYDEAVEYFDFNISQLWAGDNTPAIMYDGTAD